MDETMENMETTESTDLDSSEVLDTGEEDVEVLGEDMVEETELVVLQRIDTTLTHMDSVLQYGVSLLIIFMLVLILHYIYKFFKMFF